MEIGLVVAASFFFVMGALALASPSRFTKPLGICCETRNGRNEVRGVYGGFGIAMTIICIVALINLDLRSGLLWGLAAAMFGMVAGRAWSVIIDRGAGAIMWAAIAVELCLGSVLVAIANGALRSVGFYS